MIALLRQFFDENGSLSITIIIIVTIEQGKTYYNNNKKKRILEKILTKL